MGGIVSVVIPTRDAGPGFKRVLEAIRAQRAVGDLELVVADSGSRDGTVEAARAAGAQILEIRPEDFGHGRTRDRAVAASSGDVILMMVQDAILVGARAIHDLVDELESDELLAAVAARHIPRHDADLFGAYILWLHETTMSGARARPAGIAPRTALERRADASLEDVCSAIRRSAWEELRYRDIDYGEDVDFGLRALERGWRIGRSRRAAVIHSHTRQATYHLRRNVVDRIVVPVLLGEDGRHSLAAPERLAAAAAAGVRRLEAALQGAATTPDVELNAFVAAVAARLEQETAEPALDGELGEVVALLGDGGQADMAAVVAVCSYLVGALRSTPVARWAGLQCTVGIDDARAFVSRLAATVVGAALGDAIRVAGANGDLSARLTAGV